MSVSNELQSQIDALLTTSTPLPPPVAHAFALPTVNPADVPAPAPPPRFSPFDPAQMLQAVELAGRFSSLANASDAETGLRAVVDEAAQAASAHDPELVRHAFMLFATHDPQGNQFKIKPLEKRAPEQILPSTTPETLLAPAPGIHSESDLNWFREDPKANEHHEHWHLVYPWSGLFGPAGPQAQDRQGELFLYMHEQMLARYNAERLAVGLAPVTPLPLSNDPDYTEPIPEEYSPDTHLVAHVSGQPFPFSSRPTGEHFGDLPGGHRVAVLKRWGDNLLDAARTGTFSQLTNPTTVTADSLGATLESSIASVDPAVQKYIRSPRPILPSTIQGYLNSPYGSHHNEGHVFLADINDPTNPRVIPGVMALPRTAIRDPVFFRWHKHIDDISHEWQQHQAPYDFSDAPKVKIRKGLSGTTPANQSPDIILCFKDVLPLSTGDDSDAFWQSFGETQFGGTNWESDFSTQQNTTSEFQTAMCQRTITFTEDNQQTETIPYLLPREFFYFLRVENQQTQSQKVTVRIFLAPTGPYAGIADVSEDRRMWIEMDKFVHTLQASQQAVIFRRAEASSVIRRPALKTFPPIQIPDTDPDDDSGDVRCECGWPYNLLLPRGTQAGMKFRLMVMISDWERDHVADPTSCGSMSYCGAKNIYPDRRGMGYPFDRPFPPGQSIAQFIASRDNIAARDITIKWLDSIPGLCE